MLDVSYEKKLAITIALLFFHSVNAMDDNEASDSFRKVLSGVDEVDILLISRNNGSYYDVQTGEKEDDYGDISNSDLNKVFQNIKDSLSTTKWNIVVFNWMFFSKSVPLQKARVEQIKKLFFDTNVTSQELNKRTILFSNFLYTDRISHDTNVIENAETNITLKNVVIGNDT